MKRVIIGLIALVAALWQPQATMAGELEVTGDLSGFTSPDTVYGPWRSASGTFRWAAGKDTPSVTLVNRADSDRLGPTHSFGGTIDDYHDWNPRTFTYVAIGVASGSVLPTRNVYVEADQKFGRSLSTVVGAGYGVVVNPNGVVQRFINVGPAFYYGGFNVSLRYLQTFTTGRTGAGTGIATFQAGSTGKTLSTLTLLAGDQPPNGGASFSKVLLLGQRALLASFAIKHWTSPNGGFSAGLELERLNDRSSGSLVYVRRGITVGAFSTIGAALP